MEKQEQKEDGIDFMEEFARIKKAAETSFDKAMRDRKQTAATAGVGAVLGAIVYALMDAL